MDWAYAPLNIEGGDREIENMTFAAFEAMGVYAGVRYFYKHPSMYEVIAEEDLLKGGNRVITKRDVRRIIDDIPAEGIGRQNRILLSLETAKREVRRSVNPKNLEATLKNMRKQSGPYFRSKTGPFDCFCRLCGPFFWTFADSCGPFGLIRGYLGFC